LGKGAFPKTTGGRGKKSPHKKNPRGKGCFSKKSRGTKIWALGAERSPPEGAKHFKPPPKKKPLYKTRFFGAVETPKFSRGLKNPLNRDFSGGKIFRRDTSGR